MFNHRQGYIIRADNGIIILHPDSMSDEIKQKSGDYIRMPALQTYLFRKSNLFGEVPVKEKLKKQHWPF